MRQCVQWTESFKQKEQNNNHVWDDTDMDLHWNHGPKGCRSQFLVFLVPRASLTNPWTSFLQLAASLFVTPLKHRMLRV